MQIISGTTQFKIPDGTAVAIGKFDGLHLGHRKLLDMILRQKEDGLKAAVFTFDPSPEVFFGMVGIEGDWPVARRKAAFDAYLAVMADTDFTDDTNNDRDLPFKATAQCVSMNYTNALPHMRRLVLNPTLPEWKRRTE